MAATTLVIITQSFPYDVGDEHFEDELPYLSACFHQVVIIPRSKVNNRTRQVPENCTVRPMPYQSSLKNLWLLLHPACLQLLLQESIRIWKESGIRQLLPRLRVATGSLLRARQLASSLQQAFAHRWKKESVVFYSYWLDLSSLALALLRLRHTDVIAVARAHAYDIYHERHPFGYIPFQQLKLNHLNRVFFVSQYGLDYVLSRQPLASAHRFTVARLGCQALTATPQPDSNQTLRIISVGKNAFVKRTRLALEALALLAAWPLEWWCLGDTPQDNPHLQPAVHQLKANNPNVRLQFCGWLSRNEFRKLLQTTRFDLMLHLSATEGIPVSMMECQAAGIPAVATSVGGVPELITDGVNGFLLPPDPSPQQVAACMEKFIRLSPEHRQQMRENSIQKWRSDFNAATNFPGFARQLATLANAGQH